MKNKDIKLTEGNIGKILFNLTLPMIFGMLGFVIFNIVDTYYVAKLGILPVAALTFTFPVVLVISSLAQGIGIGASALVSKAIGENNHHKIVRYATDSLILGLALVFVFVVIGLFTIDPLFTALGADDLTLPIIREYMQIWYMGVIFVIIPMIGNNTLRALGDTKTPALVMTIAAGVNVVLDPIFIFGLGSIPAMGVRGAAIATVIARAITLIVSLHILINKRKLVTLKNIHFGEVIQSFKDLLYIGIPNALTKIMQPISIGIITSIIAIYGNAAVAGFGITTRIEMFAMMISGALVTVFAPFIGQNIGAGKINRVKESLNLSVKFLMALGAIFSVMMFLIGGQLASIFTENVEIIKIAKTYLMIVPLSYGLQGVFTLGTTALNVLNKPILSTMITLIRTFLLYIPLALIGSNLLGLNGIWIAVVISFSIMAFISDKITKKTIDDYEVEYIKSKSTEEIIANA